MRISAAHIQGIKDWMVTETTTHYLFYASKLPNNHIIYGMDEPQKTYLGLARWWEGIDWTAVGPKDAYVGGSTPLIEDRAQQDKTTDPRVSNYQIAFRKAATIGGGGTIDAPQRLTFSRAPQRLRTPTAAADVTRETARRDFATRYAGSHYGLAGTNVGQWAKGAAKDRGTSTDIWNGLKASEFYYSMQSYAVRRACKYLIYDSIGKGDTIIYCLDDMNLESVARKQWLYKATDGDPESWLDEATASTRDSNAALNKVPICTSEIRELFRCWDFFSTPFPGGRAKVVFMRDFKPVDPPWETGHQQYWAQYAVHLKNKMLASSAMTDSLRTAKQALITSIDTDFTARNYADAITAYHGCEFGALKLGSRTLPV